MPELRIVRLFGKPYWWHKQLGQPLELLPYVPLSEPAPRWPCPTGRHHAHPGLDCDEYEQWRREMNEAIRKP